MTFEREHVLLTWGGSLPGNETWACSLRTAPMAVVPGAVLIADSTLEDLVGSYNDAVATFHTDPNTGISQHAILKWCKLAAIDQDGKYKQGQTSVVHSTYAGGTGIGGGSTFGTPANQVALAVSLVTSEARGLASKGRFYLPLPTAAPGTDGLIPVDNAQATRQAVKTFLEAIADVPGIDIDTSCTPVVMSQVGEGRTRKIIGAKVGRALDTQRRRRRSLPENYQEIAIDTGVF